MLFERITKRSISNNSLEFINGITIEKSNHNESEGIEAKMTEMGLF